MIWGGIEDVGESGKTKEEESKIEVRRGRRWRKKGTGRSRGVRNRGKWQKWK